MKNERSARLGTMPMSQLVWKISMPIMFSMLIQALYNIVDSMFVAKYSSQALTAVSLAFPVQMLMIAVGVGTGVGLNSLISRLLGEKRPGEARAVANNGIMLAVISWAAFALFGSLFSEPFFRAFTQDEAAIAMGNEYLRIVTIFSFGLFLQLAVEKIMQASGNTVYNMIVQCSGAVINIVLDPIFIFGWGPIPSMGVAGAAIATVTGQIIAMILGFVMNQWKNKELAINLKGFKPNARVVKSIYVVGFPSIIMQSIGSVMTIFMNMILIGFGDIAVSVLGVYFKLQSFVFMPVFGLTNGLIAIIGYNYGARNKKRIYDAIKVALTYALIIMAVGTLMFMLAPEAMLSLFESQEELLVGELTRIGVPALRIISISFLMAAVGIILSTVFQAVGNGFLSLIMSLARQLIVLLPMAWVLANWKGLDAVWWAFPVSEVVSLSLCLVMYRWVDRKYLKPIPE